MSSTPNAPGARTLTEAQVLATLVHRHADGLPLPSHVIDRAGRETPLLVWLHGLRFDRSEFSGHAASRLDLQAERPMVSEAAITLRARLAARAA